MIDDKIKLDDNPREALRRIASYLRTLDMTPSRAVYDLCEPEEAHRPYSLTRLNKRDEIAGYWQCAEWLEDLKGIADECDRIRALPSGPAWTPDRPTEPGEYWLSIEPGKRPGKRRPDVVFPTVVTFIVYGGGQGCFREGGLILDLSDDWFDGALWAKRETPADPFKEQTT